MLAPKSISTFCPSTTGNPAEAYLHSGFEQRCSLSRLKSADLQRGQQVMSSRAATSGLVVFDGGLVIYPDQQPEKRCGRPVEGREVASGENLSWIKSRVARGFILNHGGGCCVVSAWQARVRAAGVRHFRAIVG
ncbi:hypothetical protein [Tardiphaga sp. vice154]|uniref:hypothetical protein n=1 Tax=Tardiphaga sp. vice154 TaxID=2592814 RepID=UPI001FEFC885|nr:hypothetical protein [Tardiphaga sp. vice154]